MDLADVVARREQWLVASNAVAQDLLSGEDYRFTLRRIAELARQAAGARVATIARPSNDGSVLQLEVVDAEEDGSQLNGLAIPWERTVSGAAFTSGEPVVVRDYGAHVLGRPAASPRVVPALVKDLDAAVVVPMIAASERLGVLVVARYGNDPLFTDTDVQLVRSFAAHAALAISFAAASADRRRLAVLADRARIARDLHDVVVQRLYATGLRLYAMRDRVGQPDLARELTRRVDDLDHAVQDIRASIFSLEAPDRPGLRSELWHTVHEFADVLGFEPIVNIAGPLDAVVPDVVRPDIGATLREALSNVARHAGATSVYIDIAVDEDGDQLTLTVVDNGSGAAPQPRHSGLANLHARASRWAGTLAIQQEPGQGTKLVWHIMLPPPGRDRLPGGGNGSTS